MAANTRTFSPPHSVNQVVFNSEFNKLDTNGAESINRNSTVGGYRRVPLAPSAQFTLGGAPGLRLYHQAAGNEMLYTYAFTPAESIQIPLHGLPHGHLLVGAKADFLPPDAVRGGNPPASMPGIRVSKFSDTGAQTILGTANKAWVSEADYESGFIVTLGALAETIDLSDTVYMVELLLEGGANSFDGMLIRSLHLNVTIDPALGGPDFSHWR